MRQSRPDCPPEVCVSCLGVEYAGDITPLEAWKLLSDNPEAVLVDVRTDAEWRFVGVPDLSSLGREVVYIEWNTSDGRRNENFLAELRDQIPPGQLPASGRWCSSVARATVPSAPPQVATEAGIAPAYNVLDGFEGQLDAHGHRGETGWRAVGLPWNRGSRDEAAMTDQPSVRTPKELPDGVSQATIGVRGGLLRSGFEETAEAMFLTSGYVYRVGGRRGEVVHRRAGPLCLLALRQPHRDHVRRTVASDRGSTRGLRHREWHGRGVHLAGRAAGRR